MSEVPYHLLHARLLPCWLSVGFQGPNLTEKNFGSGSPAGPREPDLDPVDLPDETNGQTSDFWRPKWILVNRRRSRVRSDEPFDAPLH